MCFRPLSPSGQHLVYIWARPCSVGLCVSVTICVFVGKREGGRQKEAVGMEYIYEFGCVRDWLGKGINE